jgi:two-component system LytT family response regulator
MKSERMLSNFNSKFNKKRITINTARKLLFLDVDGIIYVESDGNYSTLFLKDQKNSSDKKAKRDQCYFTRTLFF